MTLFPNVSTCPICPRAQAQNKPHRMKAATADAGSLQQELRETPATFGACITADHIVLGNSDETSRKGDTSAFVIQDHATKWIGCYTSPTKSAQMGLMRLARGDAKVDRVYADGSGELMAASGRRAMGPRPMRHPRGG